MLRVTIELVPKGDESRKRVIAQARIRNDCTGCERRGNYIAQLGTERTANWRECEVKEFPRLRLNVWFLLLRVLKAALERKDRKRK